MKQYCLYNITFNISSVLGNNTFSIKWINNEVVNVILEDGYYDIQILNERLQYELVSEKWHLQSISNSKEVLYFLTITSNFIRYTSQIDVLYYQLLWHCIVSIYYLFGLNSLPLLHYFDED